MSTVSPPTDTLLRRLVDQYWLYGLGCLFSCVAVSLILAWQGTLTQHIASATVGPLLLLLIGGFLLRRTVTVHAEIEEQLSDVSSGSRPVEEILRPIHSRESVAHGWNQIVEAVQDRQVLASIEQQLNEAIQGGGEELSRVLDAMSDGVALTSGEGEIIFANSVLAGLLNASTATNLIGTKFAERLAGELGKQEPTLKESLLRGDGVRTWELRAAEASEGGVYRIRRIALEGSESSHASDLWIIRDVTQQKLAEEARDRFLVTATHELRTPLANLKAYAETLSLVEEISVEDQKRFCNIINGEATRLARFVDDLLNISQMEAGAVRLSRQEIDLARLLDEMLPQLRPLADQKQITFDVRLPAKLPTLIVDKDKLSASLVNLIGNGIKYTPENGSVVFSLEVDEEQVRFHVEDTGIGIAPEDLPNMFRKFFRSADARVQEVTGSGLGLAFTHEVARMHGGSLTVESELNKGSHFTMTIPRERSGN